PERTGTGHWPPPDGSTARALDSCSMLGQSRCAVKPRAGGIGRQPRGRDIVRRRSPERRPQLMPESKLARVAGRAAATVGHGAPQVSAAAGYTTTLRDVTQELVDRGVEAIQANLARAVSKGKIAMEDQDHAMLKLKKTVDLGEAVANADLVIEAVPENL